MATVGSSTVGFDDRDYFDTRRPRPRVRHGGASAQPWMEPFPAGFRTRLAPAIVTNPELVDRARAHLVARLLRAAEAQGATVDESTVTWDSWLTDAGGSTTLELRAELVPKTDGEWPAIRQALYEDQQDRDRVAAAGERVSDRLDALRAAAAVWSAGSPRAVREALETATAPG